MLGIVSLDESDKEDKEKFERFIGKKRTKEQMGKAELTSKRIKVAEQAVKAQKSESSFSL